MAKSAEVRCLLKAETFALQFQSPCAAADLMEISVALPRVQFLGENQRETLQFTLNLGAPCQFCARSDMAVIHVRISDPSDVAKFLNANLPHLIGLFSALLLVPGSEDAIWVCSRSAQSVWVLGTKWTDRCTCEAVLAPCNRQTDADNSFYLAPPGARPRLLPRLHKLLRDPKGLGLPAGFPFYPDNRTESAGPASALAVKVHPSESWFLSYPIDAFRNERLPGFGQYSLLDWILTEDKTFIQNSCQRALLREELRDERNFLKHSVIVVNTYPRLYSPTICGQCDQGMQLLKQMFSTIQDVAYADETLSLRWYVNPTPGLVHAELTNPNTRYFFASFHVDRGVWQPGTGKSYSSRPGPEPQEVPDLSFVRNLRLPHLRLMRLFHCHSIGDPHSVSHQPPIGLALLRCGAMRVEGSLGEEDLLDYLCYLLGLLTDEEALGVALVWKCWEEGTNFRELKAKADTFRESLTHSGDQGVLRG